MFFKQCITCILTLHRVWHPHHLSAFTNTFLYPEWTTSLFPCKVKLRAITLNPCAPFTSVAISGGMKGSLVCFAEVFFLFCPKKPLSVPPTQTSTVRLGEPLCSVRSGRKFWCIHQHTDRLAALWCSRGDVIQPHSLCKMWVSSFYWHCETAERRAVSLTCSPSLAAGGGGKRDVQSLSSPTERHKSWESSIFCPGHHYILRLSI